MKLDVIIPLKTSILSFAIEYSIPSVLSKTSYHNVYVVTKRDNFSMLEAAFGTALILIDEDSVHPGLTIDELNDYFRKRTGTTTRAGWYFQQFLKLGVSELTFVAPLYLVWDADAILLKPIDFIGAEGQVYVSTSKMQHKPYFGTLYKLIGMKKQVNYSFITDHMVFNKEYVKEILDRIVEGKGQPWWIAILECIADESLPKSGFSEYELYGDYVAMRHPHHFQVRRLCRVRWGSSLLGAMPSRSSLKIFSHVCHYIMFEEHGPVYRSRQLRYRKIIEQLLMKLLERAKIRLMS